MKYTFFPNGTKRFESEINQIDIPDLWHIAQAQEKHAREQILETWYLAHELKRLLAEASQSDQ